VLASSDDAKLKALASKDPNVASPKALPSIHINKIKRPTNYNQIMKPVRRSRGGKVFGLNHFVFDPQNAIQNTENYAQKLFQSSSMIDYIEKFFTEMNSKNVKSNVVGKPDQDKFTRGTINQNGSIDSWRLKDASIGRHVQESFITYSKLAELLLENDKTAEIDILGGRSNKESSGDAGVNNFDKEMESIGIEELDAKKKEVAQDMLEYLNVTTTAAYRLLQANVGDNSYSSADPFKIDDAFKMLKDKDNDGNVEDDWKQIWSSISNNIKKVFNNKSREKYVCAQALNTRMDKLRESVNTFITSELERQASTPESNTKIGKAASMHSRKIRVNLPKLKQLWNQTYNKVEQDQPEFLREFTAGETMNYFIEVMVNTVPQTWAAVIVMIKALDGSYIGNEDSISSKPSYKDFNKMYDEMQDAGYKRR